ncbi:DGQHR domain-containing protein [Mucilaginibacter terrigena]|uniref:DGQHR domain-containing protein n=1 Tax=Mucilaginibacter terrigena TaxID=2492395 RepID=A0A4Q5LPN9_9SPHI|nr:DGQHR domain-containing protein [Mucilaginibacter terrigena]RYU91352.1 DGQHR domain-containing protein [Mucilaginibacter terrigena]
METIGDKANSTTIKDGRILGLPVLQNQQEFIVSVFSISQILKFTKFTNRFIVSYDEDNKPIYNEEIQREVEKGRVEKIADFLIDDPEATFPTNLVLHIPQQVIEEQLVSNGYLELFLKEEVFEEVKKEKEKENTGNIYITIIDGQHRIRGIEVAIERLVLDIDLLHKALYKNNTNETLNARLNYFQKRLDSLLKIQLVVSFFIDKSLEYQAMIFSTINRTQKRVSESLVASLFGLTTNDSPQKTALQVVLSLNSHEQSPFYNRINLYGGDYPRNESPPLSQATMIKSIVDLICENLREAERDRFKNRKELLKRNLGSQKFLPFRLWYANDSDTKISDAIYYFFTAVKKVFLDRNAKSLWEFDPQIGFKPKNILQTTVGYLALLSIMVDILKDCSERSNLNQFSLNTTVFENFLNKAKGINILDSSRYQFTSRSKNILYYDISLLIWPPISQNDERFGKLSELLKTPI